MQIALSVNPINTNDRMLDIEQLNRLLQDGYEVNTTCASITGSILVIVEKADKQD